MPARRSRTSAFLAGMASMALLGVVVWLVLPRLLPEQGASIGFVGNGAPRDPTRAGQRALPTPLRAVPPPPVAYGGQGPAPLPPPEPVPARAAPAALPVAGARLLVPVAGVKPEELVDTYTQSRGAGRPHNAIDIPAPSGTPVVAAADGRVIQLFRSDQGGITLYQLDPDGRTLYYYAHLQQYAPGVREGVELQRGDTLGYVGDTGNAGGGNYHLHFGVSLTRDPKQWWGGKDVNPYPLLVGERAAETNADTVP